MFRVVAPSPFCDSGENESRMVAQERLMLGELMQLLTHLQISKTVLFKEFI